MSASEAREPSEGIGAFTPRPRKERKLSVKMALGICSAVEMMTTEMQLGSRCFVMIHLPFAPVAWAASTYSCSRRERIWPRIRRAMLTQYRRPNTMNMEMMFEPIFSSTVPSREMTWRSTTDSRMMTSSANTTTLDFLWKNTRPTDFQ